MKQNDKVPSHTTGPNQGDTKFHQACLMASTVANYLRTSFHTEGPVAVYEDDVLAIQWLAGPPRPWDYDENNLPCDNREPAIQVTTKEGPATNTVLRVSPRTSQNPTPTIFLPGPWTDHLNSLLGQAAQKAADQGQVLLFIPA